jgi:hypothetical protein
LLGFAGSLGVRLRAAFVDLDGRKTASGDSQRERPILLVAPPDRQRAAGGRLFDQTLGDELADEFLGDAALQIRGELNAAIRRRIGARAGCR